MLRQLFDTVNYKYQKSKKIATDSNYLRCHALLTALHFPLETTWSCKQDRKERYWGQQFWQNDQGRNPFNQHSDRSDREKRTTSKGGPVFSKLFRLDRTDPLSFGPKFPEILVEWIAPNRYVSCLRNAIESKTVFSCDT